MRSAFGSGVTTPSPKWPPTSGEDGKYLGELLGFPMYEAVPHYSDAYPKQLAGDTGCICRTCGQRPALYLDQCDPCRHKSSVNDDREYLRPGGEWDQRREHDRRLHGKIEKQRMARL